MRPFPPGFAPYVIKMAVKSKHLGEIPESKRLTINAYPQIKKAGSKIACGMLHAYLKFLRGIPKENV